MRTATTERRTAIENFKVKTILRNYEIDAVSQLKKEYGDYVEVVQVDDHIHIYVKPSETFGADEVLSILMSADEHLQCDEVRPIFKEVQRYKESERTMTENKDQVNAKAWYDQMIPFLPQFVEQLLALIGRMIGVQVNAATDGLKKEVSDMKSEVSKRLEEQIKKQEGALLVLQKRQEQILQDLEAKIQAKTASLDFISNVLAKAGESLSQVKK